MGLCLSKGGLQAQQKDCIFITSLFFKGDLDYLFGIWKAEHLKMDVKCWFPM